MYYFVSPNGTKYKTDKLKQFCEEKEITYHGAKKCLRGIQKHFADGWTVSQNVKEDQAEDKVDIRNIRVLWNKGNLWYSAQDILFALGYTSNLNDSHIASSVIPVLTKGSRVYWNSTSILNFKDKLFKDSTSKFARNWVSAMKLVHEARDKALNFNDETLTENPVIKELKEKLETEQQKNLELKVENSVILTNNKQLKSLLDTPVVISFTKGILSKDNQVLTCSVSELPTLLNKMLNEKFTVVKITY